MSGYEKVLVPARAPRDFRDVVRAPTPPPVVHNIVERAPTPEPDIYERVTFDKFYFAKLKPKRIY
jgi:hypothetical protein